MIDIERRKKLAYHLRQLSNGQISNDEFEESVMNDVTFGWLPEQYYRSDQSTNDDPVIRPILEMAWGLYDDTRNHKLNGRDSLTEYGIKEIARYILFLQSDQEYDWDYVDLTHPLIRFSFKDILKSILTLGEHYRELKLRREQEYERMKKSGNFEYWPFKTKADFERQLNKQPFLIGTHERTH
ncbi:hypothetical protein [Roseivirga thermotolerans]|uniref:hypothetical protein n=1 Tax=Roseivirga thermotolerans TaxID=1758176 RepID=UPI00273EA0BC|nr:hypothetical protein [Roseivirga thermotolerans]